MLHKAFAVYVELVENVYLYTDYRVVGSLRARTGVEMSTSFCPYIESLCRHTLCIVT